MDKWHHLKHCSIGSSSYFFWNVWSMGSCCAALEIHSKLVSQESVHLPQSYGQFLNDDFGGVAPYGVPGIRLIYPKIQIRDISFVFIPMDLSFLHNVNNYNIHVDS
jgi:hypothetical protein